MTAAEILMHIITVAQQEKIIANYSKIQSSVKYQKINYRS